MAKLIVRVPEQIYVIAQGDELDEAIIEADLEELDDFEEYYDAILSNILTDLEFEVEFLEEA